MFMLSVFACHLSFRYFILDLLDIPVKIVMFKHGVIKTDESACVEFTLSVMNN